MNKLKRFEINHVESEFPIDELGNKLWELANEAVISTYWSGEVAPDRRRSKARGLWSNDAVYFRFEASIGEPLVVSDPPNLATKTVGLWERDVCEVFIAPDARVPHKYFEFEIAPNGEWIDLAIEISPDGRKTDIDYRSEMTSAVRVEEDLVLMAIKIPFSSFGRTPKIGDVWLGNLFRCVGKDPGRGYLAWMPTMTAVPNFHVPERFGRFVFTRQ
jgi:hypothetical protein